MISQDFAFLILLISFLLFVICAIWAIDSFDRSNMPIDIFPSLAMIVFLFVLVSICVSWYRSGDRIVKANLVNYRIEETMSEVKPMNVAIVNGKIFNVTEVFNILLYDPLLYYLEEQNYEFKCPGFCLVYTSKAPTYRIVPRSAVEEQ